MMRGLVSTGSGVVRHGHIMVRAVDRVCCVAGYFAERMGGIRYVMTSRRGAVRVTMGGAGGRFMTTVAFAVAHDVNEVQRGDKQADKNEDKPKRGDECRF